MKRIQHLSLLLVLFLTACFGKQVTVGPIPLAVTPTAAATPLATSSAVPVEPVPTIPLNIPFPTFAPDVPLLPSPSSSLGIVAQAGGAWRHALMQEPYAYVLGAQEIMKLNVSISAQPHWVSRYRLPPNDELHEMYLVENWLAVSLATPSSVNDCDQATVAKVFDISQAREIKEVIGKESCFILDTALTANHFYILSAGEGDALPSLTVFDLAQENGSIPVNEMTLPEWETESGQLAGAVLAAADNHLLIGQTTQDGNIQRLAEYALDDPATPRLVNTYEEGTVPEDWQRMIEPAELPYCCSNVTWARSEAYDVDIYQGILYVMAAEGLQLWQQRNTSALQMLASYPELAGMTTMLALGEYVMLVGPNAAATQLSFHLYQRSDPTQPYPIVTSELPYRGEWVDWVQDGQWLYVAVAHGIQIISLENLVAPVEIAFLSTYPGVQAFAVHGETLVLLWPDRLELVQQTTTDTWTTISTIPAGDLAFQTNLEDMNYDGLSAVAVVGEHLIALSDFMVAAFDIGNPTEPVFINHTYFGATGGHFFPAGEGGVLLVGEASGPVNEVLVGLDVDANLLWYENWANRPVLEDLVLGEDGLLYAAAGEDGLVILQPVVP